VTEAIFLADRVVVLTPRPGRLAHIFPIDLPRPRTVAQTFSPGFIRTLLTIKRTIETGAYQGDDLTEDVGVELG
jgi:NitT/TauT family transport system ATP-binding protein